MNEQFDYERKNDQIVYVGVIILLLACCLWHFKLQKEKYIFFVGVFFKYLNDHRKFHKRRC